MKLQISPSKTPCNWYHLWVNNEHIAYDEKENIIRRVVALIRMSDCDVGG